MGGAASVDVNPQQLATQQIADRIKALGPEFAVYADKYVTLVNNGVQCPSTPKDLEKVGATSSDHQMRIMAEIDNLASSNSLKLLNSQPPHRRRAFFRNTFSFKKNTAASVSKAQEQVILEPTSTYKGSNSNSEIARTPVFATSPNEDNGGAPQTQGSVDKTIPKHAVSALEQSVAHNNPEAASSLPNDQQLVFLSYARGGVSTPFAMWLSKTLQVGTLNNDSYTPYSLACVGGWYKLLDRLRENSKWG
jgi:hypothetical protein